MKKKSSSFVILSFILFINVISIIGESTSQIGVYGVGFNWLHNDSVTERGDSFLIKWQWYIGLAPAEDMYIYGYKFILTDNTVIYNYGYDGNTHLIDDAPNSFLFVFRNYTNNVKRQSFGILAHIRIVSESYSGYYDSVYFLKITWIPTEYSGIEIEIPTYYYYIIIPLGILGIILFVLKYYYSCENIDNIKKKRCKVYLDSLVKEVQQKERIELYEKLREKTTTKLFGEKK